MVSPVRVLIPTAGPNDSSKHHYCIHLLCNGNDNGHLLSGYFANLLIRDVAVYLHKEGYDEDSILLPKSVLQSVKQSAVPVNQMELQTDRETTERNLCLRGDCSKQV